ncbi:BZ3500_MvSof-1268-A1-R1_Chr6-3g08675 [Microbotryum saponariae]|uniref:BZ3500_MvSof-1268-A1-R1_Chr6-3g08675 protein n=1 Tax=Microbotryum saponariae TaxID=289078 RepID=A0A2X0MGZ9_9BASI|nr:BZ3500_MvSof-1268-A1-R1_Chr6-3g08675 [Microbotryum saponariae]SDA07276.1 BZ3501_MvSof-1269-A2-R1_Chr6-2g08378 [Microbotryum saponariae]
MPGASSTPGLIHISSLPRPSVSTPTRSSPRHNTSRKHQHQQPTNHPSGSPKQNNKATPRSKAATSTADEMTTTDDEPLFVSLATGPPSAGTRSRTKAHRSRPQQEAQQDLSTFDYNLGQPSREYDSASPSLVSRSAPRPSHHHLEQHHDRSNARRNTNKIRTSRQAAQPSSSSDEWDMPTPSNGDATTNAASSQPLSWQQELLTQSSSEKTTRPKKNNSNTNRGQRTTPTNANHSTHEISPRPAKGGGKNQQGQGARPALTASQSEGTPNALTWQQQLLQTSGGGGTNSISSMQTSQSAGNATPAKLRRQQQKDNETFGIGTLALDQSDSDAANGYHHHHTNGTHSPRTPQRRSDRTSSKKEASQPIAFSPSAEPRYAGPTFHNSPLPSSLPTPSFILRKQQQQQQQLQQQQQQQQQ